MLKAIVFDLDHTLYDRYATMEKTLPACWEEIKDNINDGFDYDRFHDLIIETDKRFNYDGWDARVEYLEDLGMFKEPVNPEEFRLTVYEGMMKIAVHFDYTLPLLDSLRKRGYKLGIITNGEDYIQRKKIELLNFSEYFDLIYICGERGKSKPSPAPFLETAEILGVLPEECVYVGDNPRNDVFGARGAGYETVWVATTGPWRYYSYERADFEVENISYLEDILPEIEADMMKKGAKK